MGTELAKRRKTAAAPAGAARAEVERQLAWAAGAEGFRHRDPLYHVTESFQQLFDGIGRRHAAALEGGSGGELPRSPEGTAAARETDRTETQAPPASAWFRRPEGGARNAGFAGGAVHTFSETAFQRGKLSASVLEGTGKLMLISCLRRTVGQSEPVNARQRSVLGTGSQTRNVPGRSPDRMLFNRGFVNSAVGLVVDTLRDARRTVDSLAEMAQGTGELDAHDSGALRRMYPFLDDSRERTLLAAYRERLAAGTDPRETGILQNAAAHAEALIAKKAQMKNEFINKLRLISDRATEALAELEAPGARDEIAAAVLPEPEPEAPPEEPPEDRGGKDGQHAADEPEPAERFTAEPDADGGDAGDTDPQERA